LNLPVLVLLAQLQLSTKTSDNCYKTFEDIPKRHDYCFDCWFEMQFLQEIYGNLHGKR